MTAADFLSKLEELSESESPADEWALLTLLQHNRRAIADIVRAVKSATVALNDWMLTYAPEMCEPKDVEEAKKRIYSDGTLFYIASHIKLLRDSTAALKGAE